MPSFLASLRSYAAQWPTLDHFVLRAVGSRTRLDEHEFLSRPANGSNTRIGQVDMPVTRERHVRTKLFEVRRDALSRQAGSQGLDECSHRRWRGLDHEPENSRATPHLCTGQLKFERRSLDLRAHSERVAQTRCGHTPDKSERDVVIDRWDYPGLLPE